MKLQPYSGVIWEMHLAFLVKRMPFTVACGNAYLDGAGGYSLSLNFWWHLEFQDELVLRMIKHIPNNNNNDLISINLLKYHQLLHSFDNHEA